MAYNDFNMDSHWLPFTPNRHFRKEPRVFVGADGMHDSRPVRARKGEDVGFGHKPALSQARN